MIRFTILEGIGVGSGFSTDKPNFIVGRGDGCDWQLLDNAARPTLSREHFRVDCTGSVHILTDLSTNGVFANEAARPVGRGQARPLADGDRLRLGSYVLSTSIGPGPARAQAVAADAGAGLWFDGPAGTSDPFAPSAPAPAATSPFAPSEPLPPFAVAPPDLGWPPFAAQAEPVFSPAAELVPFPPVEQPPFATAQPCPSAPIAMPADAGPDLLQAFLAGAEMPADTIPTTEAAAALRMAGRLCRIMVEQLRSLLAARAQLKSEFRIERTMIGGAANNPLKFAGDAGACLSQMLLAPLPGYLPGDRAVRLAFEDVLRHELATSVGMQSALSELLRRFDPQSLQGRLSSPSALESLLPQMRQARLWQLFEQRYADVAAEAEDDFQSLFSRAFARAYEQEERRGRSG